MSRPVIRRRDAIRACDDFNAKYPVGTPIRYWRGVKEGEGIVASTVTEATVLSGTAVVWHDRGGGCIALTHVEVVN